MKKSLILFLVFFGLNSIYLHAANKLYEKIDLFGKQLAMHIAASNPMALSSDLIGTDIIKKCGEKHILSLKPIFYTSKDSVVQIACHENIFGLKKLYELCEFSAKVFHPLKVGRVIARPFLGDNSGTFFRTKNRKDYTFPPPNKTLCDLVVENNRSCHAIGKIADIFSNRGISTSVSGLSDDALFYKMIDVIKKAKFC